MIWMPSVYGKRRIFLCFMGFCGYPFVSRFMALDFRDIRAGIFNMWSIFPLMHLSLIVVAYIKLDFCMPSSDFRKTFVLSCIHISSEQSMTSLGINSMYSLTTFRTQRQWPSLCFLQLKKPWVIFSSIWVAANCRITKSTKYFLYGWVNCKTLQQISLPIEYRRIELPRIRPNLKPSYCSLIQQSWMKIYTISVH